MASNHVVSATLVVEREELRHQLKVQKLLYAILMATRKLLHYFTNREVTVVTSYPLRDIIRNRDAVG